MKPHEREMHVASREMRAATRVVRAVRSATTRDEAHAIMAAHNEATPGVVTEIGRAVVLLDDSAIFEDILGAPDWFDHVLAITDDEQVIRSAWARAQTPTFQAALETVQSAAANRGADVREWILAELVDGYDGSQQPGRLYKAILALTRHRR